MQQKQLSYLSSCMKSKRVTAFAAAIFDSGLYELGWNIQSKSDNVSKVLIMG